MLKIITAFILVFFCCGSALAQAPPFTTSISLTNTWRWTPATGEPDHYIVEIQKSGDWTADATPVPATVTEGYVYTTIVSQGIEIYRIRVIAVDAAGNQSAPSDPSAWLLVFPGLPGSPELVE